MGLTADITRSCKDFMGGVETLYVTDWVKYNRTQVVLTGQTVTTYPDVVLYKIEAENISFTETSSFDGGSEKWEQSINFDLPKSQVSNELYKLLKQDFRVFYVDRIGNIRVCGLWNGLTGQITGETGADKAGLNGYRFSANGTEDNQAYYINAITEVEAFNAIFQDGNNIIFQDGNNKIYN
jgi:hypothetical protein